jgi:hypothetical protein
VAVAEEIVDAEKRRVELTAWVGACLYLVPLGVVALLRGESPGDIPYYHLAIPIAALVLTPVLYLLMPLFDSVIVFGQPRLTTPRAALMARCVLTNAMGILALWVFFHGQSVRWFLVLWALGLPAAFGIIRRIGAYKAAIDRTMNGEADQAE